MENKTTSGIMLTLLSTSMFLLASPASGSVSGIELMYRTSYLLPKGWIYVLVEASVFTGIEASLNRYAKDLELIDGFSVGIYTVSTSDATAIRSFLQQALPEGLVGCLLVGDIPEPYYEWSNVYGYHRHKTDFYYMDLDGVWSDTDSDGAYDIHSGEADAEIWVGTLQPSLVSGDNIQLLNNYFEKNHLYRTGKLSLPKRALAYLDDGGWDLAWCEWWVTNTVKIAYDEMVIISDPEITVASDYRNRLLEGYEWIYLSCHGSYGYHTFMHHGYWDGTLTGLDYRSIDPHTFFYVLMPCSAATGYNNLASSVVFTDTYGLLAIGTRAESPWKWGPDTEFYEALSEGKSIGESYLEDLKIYEFEIPGYEHHWTLSGDPSLHIKGYPPIVKVEIQPQALNLRSKGQWITAYIQLPEGYNPEDIDASTILLNGTIQPVLDPKYGFVTNPSEYLVDHDNDGILERMVKFNRTEVSSLIIESFNADDWGFENVTLTITGNLLDGTAFIGSDIIGTVKGDVNGDGAVNIIDLSMVAISYGAFLGESYYNHEADINQDNMIDIDDLMLVAKEYGTICP